MFNKWKHLTKWKFAEIMCTFRWWDFTKNSVCMHKSLLMVITILKFNWSTLTKNQHNAQKNSWSSGPYWRWQISNSGWSLCKNQKKPCSVHLIIQNELQIQKISLWFVPHILSADQKADQVENCQSFGSVWSRRRHIFKAHSYLLMRCGSSTTPWNKVVENGIVFKNMKPLQ